MRGNHHRQRNVITRDSAPLLHAAVHHAPEFWVRMDEVSDEACQYHFVWRVGTSLHGYVLVDCRGGWRRSRPVWLGELEQPPLNYARIFEVDEVAPILVRDLLTTS